MISTEDLDSIKVKLNDTIYFLLYVCEASEILKLIAVANCFKTLKILELKVDNEKDIFETLSGTNIDDYNYLNEEK